jgi:hypothetical protein
MKLDQLISHTVGRLMGRLLRRIAAVAAFVLFSLLTLYHLTIAGILALENLYGPLDARLIVVGIYAALAIAVLVYLVATRAKAPAAPPRGHASRRSQDLQIADLLESLVAGYATARRKSR